MRKRQEVTYIAENDDDDDEEEEEEEEEEADGEEDSNSSYQTEDNTPGNPSSSNYSRIGTKYNYQHGLRMKLREAKFYDVPKEFENLSVWRDLESYLESKGIVGRSMKNHLNNNYRFFWKLGDGKMEVHSKDLTRENVNRVVDFMKANELNYQTIMNYYKSLKHVFNYFLSYTTLSEADVVEHDRLDHIFEYCKFISTEWSKRAHEQYIEKVMAEDDIPTTSSIHSMLDMFHGDATEEMQNLIRSPRLLNRDLVAHMNRYIAAEICLGQGHRPSVVENWTVQRYTGARTNPQCNVDVNGEECIVCPVPEQKTGKQNTVQLVLRPRVAEFLKLYFIHVRDPVVQKSNSQFENILLQFDGKPFIKISKGLTDLQRKRKIPNPISVSMAKKSIERHLSSSGYYEKTLRRKLLRRSELSSDTVYWKVNSFGGTKSGTKKHRLQIAPSPPSIGSEETTRRSRRTRSEVDDGLTSTCILKNVRKRTSDDDSDEDPEVRAKPRKVRKCAKKETYRRKRSSSDSPPSAGKERVMNSLMQKYESMADVEIPTATTW